MASFSGPTSKFRSLPVATVRLVVCLLAFLLAASRADGQSAQPEVLTEPLKADAIMARVAANQDRSESLRKEYVYKQHIHIATHKPDTRMMREENADYDVALRPDGTNRQPQIVYRALLEQRQVCGLSRRACARAGQHECGPDSQLAQPRAVPEAGRTDADLIRNLRDHFERQFQERLGA